MKRSYVAIYGNTAIPRAWCPECKDYSWVISGKIACCDRPMEKTPDRYKRESEPEQHRKLPPKRLRDAQLEAQGHRCLYCERVFGSHVWRKGKRIRLKINWDHLVPYSLTQDNSANNFVAACHICNLLKSDHCFQTVDQARVHILMQWEKKGIA